MNIYNILDLLDSKPVRYTLCLIIAIYVSVTIYFNHSTDEVVAEPDHVIKIEYKDMTFATPVSDEVDCNQLISEVPEHNFHNGSLDTKLLIDLANRVCVEFNKHK